MTCDRIRPLISRYHDDALSAQERARVREHLASCAACRDVLDAYNSVYALLRAADTPAVPLDLRRNVYARITEMEARRRAPFGGGMLFGALRTTGGTVGLVAVLAALVVAVTHLNVAPSPTQPSTLSPRQVAAAGTAVSILATTPRNKRASSLPQSIRGIASSAWVRSLFADSAVLSLGLPHGSHSSSTLVGSAVRVRGNGAPLSVQPFTLTVEQNASRDAAPDIKSVTSGTPTPMPSLGADDGVAYLHLANDHPLRPMTDRLAGNAQAVIAVHAFAPGAVTRTLATPTNGQLFTGLNTGSAGQTLTFATMSHNGPDAGVFTLDPSMQQTHVLTITSPEPPDSGRYHVYVSRISPTTNAGRIYFTTVRTDKQQALTITALTEHGTVELTKTGLDPDDDYVVSPNLRRIAWVEPGNGALEEANLQGTPITHTIDTGALYPVWSPDGKNLLYLKHRPGGIMLWSPGHQPRRVVPFYDTSRRFISNIAWAPDSRYFAYVVATLDGTHDQKGTSVVYLGDTQTGYHWRSFQDRFVGAIAWLRDASAYVKSGAQSSPPSATPAVAVPTPTPQTIATQPRTGKAGQMAVAKPSPSRHVGGAASPEAALKGYYAAISRHDYRRAWGYLGFLPGDNPNYKLWANGYADTRSSVLTHIVPAPYRETSNDHAITCVGVRIKATHKDGKIVHFGGWYVLRSAKGQNPAFTGWQIVTSAASIRQGRPAAVPTQKGCIAAYLKRQSAA